MEKSYRRKAVYLGLKCKYAKVLHGKMKKKIPHNFPTTARILTKSNVIVTADMGKISLKVSLSVLGIHERMRCPCDSFSFANQISPFNTSRCIYQQ